MEILSMIVVVSAIVDPWVTTLSFVVALAMKIQGRKDVLIVLGRSLFSIAQISINYRVKYGAYAKRFLLTGKVTGHTYFL